MARCTTWRKRPSSGKLEGPCAGPGEHDPPRVLRGSMQRYLATRLLALLPVLLGILAAVFLLIRLIPGDAVQLFLGTQVEMTPDQMIELRRFFGVDKPIWAQF